MLGTLKQTKQQEKKNKNEPETTTVAKHEVLEAPFMTCIINLTKH